MNGKYQRLWRPSTDLLAKYKAAWRHVRTAYQKYEGKWRELVPGTAIILYKDKSNIKDGFICNGRNGTPAFINPLYNTQVYCSSTYGELGGAVEHNGTDHGFANDNATGPNVLENIAGGLKVITKLTTSSHTHAVPTHEHTSTGSNFGMGSYGLLPYMGCSMIYSGAVMMTTASSSEEFFSYYSAALGYLVGFSTSTDELVIKEAESHNHGSSGELLKTDSYGFNTIGTKWENNIALYYAHRHDFVHTPVSVNKIPSNFSVLPYEVNRNIFFDQLPSGTVVIFAGSTLPIGWSRLTAADDHLLSFKASSSADAADGFTHIHDGNVTSSASTVTASSGGYDSYGSGYSFYRYGGHTHTWADIHPNSVSHVPPYIKFVIGKKD